MLLMLCDRFHKLPSEVLGESTALLRMLATVRLGEGDRG